MMDRSTMEPLTPYMSNITFYLLALLFAILLVVYIYIESVRTVKMGKKLPGPFLLPIFGNALLPLGVKADEVLSKSLELDVHGDVIRALLGTRLLVFLKHPRDVEIILGSSVHINKSVEYRYFKPWLGDGLLISSGEKWRSHRKIIAPTFHMSILKTFVPLFYESSKELVQLLRKEVGKEFDCHDYMGAITTNILMETAMGYKKDEANSNSGQKYANAVMKLCNVIHMRTLNIFMRQDIIFRFSKLKKIQDKLLSVIHGITHQMVTSRKQKMMEGILSPAAEQDQSRSEEDRKADDRAAETMKMHYVSDDLDEEENCGLKKRLAFLDALLEYSQMNTNLTEAEVREEVDTIMFEGHDTISAGSSFILCLLGIHQDVQQRVCEELDEIFEGSDRRCTFQDTLRMKYMERVILETLRLFPPVPLIAREITEDVKLATNAHVLPASTTVLIPIYRIHRHEDFYEEPDVFNPDRFLPDEAQQRDPYIFIPFSAGPRSCVGRKYAMLKLKVLLSTILRNYRIYANGNEKDFKLLIDVILKISGGFMIRIEPRGKLS